jgi:MoaA/NifB/PqqE/SkfB family radical SAM enzyme
MRPASITDQFALYRPGRGHPDWPALHADAVGRAERARALLDPPRSVRADLRRRTRAYATAARSFAVNARRERAGREDLVPLYFIWTMLRSCNFHCDYCDDHRGNKYPDLDNRGVLDTDRAIRLLEIMRTRAPSVYFAGGEPTLRKDLPAITRAARDLDYYPIIINTNGSAIDRRLADPAWKSWLADMDIVIVSLDGLETSALATMWRYRKAHEVVRNLLLLRELAAEQRFKLMVNCVIQPGRLHHARAVLDLANDLGIWFCPVPLNVGPAISDRLAGDADYRALAELILERKRAGYRITGSLRMNRRLLAAEPLDCRNSLKPHIDYDGRLIWPCKASVNVDPVAIDVLAFDDVDSLYDHAVAAIDPTGFQGDGPDQCGASCNWAQNYSTDAYAHGLRHPLSLVRDVGSFLRAG